MGVHDFERLVYGQLRTLFPHLDPKLHFWFVDHNDSGFGWHMDKDYAWFVKGTLHVWMNIAVEPGCNHGLQLCQSDTSCSSDGQYLLQTKDNGLVYTDYRNPPRDVDHSTGVKCNWIPGVMTIFPGGKIHRTYCSGPSMSGRRLTMAGLLVPQTPKINWMAIRAFYTYRYFRRQSSKGPDALFVLYRGGENYFGETVIRHFTRLRSTLNLVHLTLWTL